MATDPVSHSSPGPPWTRTETDMYTTLHGIQLMGPNRDVFVTLGFE